MPVKQVLAKTMPETIVDALLEDIARGVFQPGQALRQEELAARFGVSRIPIREALRQLEKDGVVTVQPNRGAFVTVFTDADIVEVFELRLLLEVDLLKRAVAKMSASDLDDIGGALLIAERGARGRDWSKLDGDFHRVLYEPARRARQLAIVMELRALLQRSSLNEALPARTDEWLRDHRQILAACQVGDRIEAAHLLSDHLRRALRVVRERLASEGRKANKQPPLDKEVRKTMLEIKPNCECCNRDLPNGDPDARICTFECTFCARCVDELFKGVCPNCGGDFVRRPTRPAAHLETDPPSAQRFLKYHPECERLGKKAMNA
jgi:DNA-binding GntR family transcriptional regulator